MRYVLAAFCTLLLLLTLVLQASAQTGAWITSGQRYRFPITVSSETHEFVNKTVEFNVFFTTLLQLFGNTSPLNENSIRVAEVDASGAIIDSNVTFQFEKDPSYTPSVFEQGNFIIFMKGVTPPNTTRRYHVYFDTAAGFTKPVMSNLISASETTYQGQATYHILAGPYSYMFHRLGAGFAAMTDTDNRDWISHSTAPGSQGFFHGIPNIIEPEGGFHPGDTTMTSQIVSEGPLKMTIVSESNDKKWRGTYEIYPYYVQFTLDKAGHAYWYLYEGTPGGKLDLSTDYNVRSNGTKMMASQSWDADIPSPEWIYFADGTLDRSLFLYNLNDDTKTDQYWPMDGGNMTVFGFGRPGPSMDVIPGRLLFGFLETRDFNKAKLLIEGAAAEPKRTSGPTEQRPDGITPALSVTPSENCPKKPQGDADCNGSVSITDYAMWKNEFKGAATTKNGDFNGSGTVTLADYQIWRTNFR